jgi:predicted site-specific integrase-resolvase
MKVVNDPDVLMKPGEVARIFDVETKTVSKWANAGQLTVVRTIGGHRRYLRVEVLALRNAKVTLRRWAS